MAQKKALKKKPAKRKAPAIKKSPALKRVKIETAAVETPNGLPIWNIRTLADFHQLPDDQHEKAINYLIMGLKRCRREKRPLNVFVYPQKGVVQFLTEQAAQNTDLPAAPDLPKPPALSIDPSKVAKMRKVETNHVPAAESSVGVPDAGPVADNSALDQLLS